MGPTRVQALLPASLRSPYMVILYGIEVWRALPWDRRRALAGATVRLAISAHTVERARVWNPSLEGVDVLPLALEERPAAGDLDRELLARAGEGYLLVVGRLAASERYKGHDLLLESMPRLLTLRPEARLVVAGEGDDRPRLEAKAAGLGLAGRVLFTGFVSEATLGELYRRSAAFVMPSRGEGFGLVYLEAMRVAKACVAARGSAAEEIVEDGITGLLIDPDDPQALVKVLARLLAEPELSRRLGEAGLRRFREVFTPARFRARLWPFLDLLTRFPGKAADVRH